MNVSKGPLVECLCAIRFMAFMPAWAAIKAVKVLKHLGVQESNSETGVQ